MKTMNRDPAEHFGQREAGGRWSDNLNVHTLVLQRLRECEEERTRRIADEARVRMREEDDAERRCCRVRG